MRRERFQKGGGDERSQEDPTEGGCKDNCLRLISKDAIVFGAIGGGSRRTSDGD